MTTADMRTRAYVAVLVLSAAVGGLLTVLRVGVFDQPWVVLGLALLCAASERGSVQIGRTTELSIWVLPALFAAVLFGPLAGAFVGAASMLGDPETFGPRNPERAPRLKFAFYSSSRFLAGAAMGFTAAGIAGLLSSRIGQLVLGTLVGCFVGEAIDLLFAGIASRLRGREATVLTAAVAPMLVTSVTTYGPIVAALTIAYSEVSAWTAPLFFLPAFAAQRLYQMYHEQRRLADSLSDANAALARANLSFAAGLIATLDARDRYTAGHSAAVAIYCRDIARRMGLSQDLQEKAYLCGLVHDIGKVGLPPGLLEKPGALTLDERRLMQEHAAIGERILQQVDSYADIAKIVRSHHERIDGEGYPDGLRGEDIPLLSRIIAVADAYNAMTSDRPYRDAMPSRVARHRLAQAVESQLDTSVVAAFEAILAGADEDYRLARRPDFAGLAGFSQRGSFVRSTEEMSAVVA